MPFQKTIKLQNCIFQIPAQLLLRSLIDRVPKYPFWRRKQEISKWTQNVVLKDFTQKLWRRKCEEGKQLIMVQLFYYENHGKCCKNLWKHDGKKLKVRKLSPFSQCNEDKSRWMKLKKLWYRNMIFYSLQYLKITIRLSSFEALMIWVFFEID